MTDFQHAINTLDQLGIPFHLVEHPPATTTEEADSYIEGIPGVRSKSLFLCNKKATAYYLLIMDDGKQLDMKALGEKISEKGLRFCSPERLMDKMKIHPGVVSIFGLLNNPEKDITTLIDGEITGEEFISFHPGDNSKTVFIAMADMYRFLDRCGFGYRVMDI